MKKEKILNKLHDGEKVKMVNCMEASTHVNDIWACRGDSFQSCSKDEVVFLVGYSGYFLTKYLKVI